MLTGVLSGDIATLTGLFKDKNAGSGKAVSLALIGANAANYSIAGDDPGNLVADITKRKLTITAIGQNKVYDGNNAAVVQLGFGNTILGDDIYTYVGGTLTYSDKFVGNGKTITVTGIAPRGADANNYTSNSTATTTGNILP